MLAPADGSEEAAVPQSRVLLAGVGIVQEISTPCCPLATLLPLSAPCMAALCELAAVPAPAEVEEGNAAFAAVLQAQPLAMICLRRVVRSLSLLLLLPFVRAH